MTVSRTWRDNPIAMKAALTANLLGTPAPRCKFRLARRALDARGDIDAIAKHGVVGEKHVADVYSKTDSEPGGGSGCSLERSCAIDRGAGRLRRPRVTAPVLALSAPPRGGRNAAQRVDVVGDDTRHSHRYETLHLGHVVLDRREQALYLVPLVLSGIEELNGSSRATSYATKAL